MIGAQLGLVAAAFLLGSVLFSYHLPKWLRHVDVVRDSADHNPGTANALVLAGVPVGMLCLTLDMAKGFLPVWLGVRLWGLRFALLPLLMAAPVLGHAFSPWYPFRGGKAIATAFGVLLGLAPSNWAVLLLGFWYVLFSTVIVIMPHERRSVMAFFYFAVSCTVTAFLTHSYALLPGLMLVAAVPIYKNGKDLKRIYREKLAAEVLAEQKNGQGEKEKG